jgi:hypothetical protein
MRLALRAVPVVCILMASCKAIPDHPPHREPRVAERTPLPRVAPPFTTERSGNSDTVAPWAIGSVTKYESGGYIGGGSIKSNRPLARGVGSATGAPGDGTFGLDFIGFHHRPGRVFLAPSPDPSAGVPIANNYVTDVKFPKDVFNIRPVRKAVLEHREAAEERRHGGEGEGHE